MQPGFCYQQNVKFTIMAVKRFNNSTDQNARVRSRSVVLCMSSQL